MQKRISQKRSNGEIIMKQTQLMQQLATIDQPHTQIDQLGFRRHTPQYHQQDALVSLLSKSKQITQQHSKEIEQYKKSQKKVIKSKKEGEGTFLTGTGIASQMCRRGESGGADGLLQSDPNEMLKQLMVSEGRSDLQELRRLIRQTSTNLQGCSRKLNKNKRSIMSMADKYSNEVPYSTISLMNRYEEFDAKRMEDQDYYCRH